MKVVINTCFGGFGLSKKAYEKLIEWGVPVKKYIEQKRNPKTKLYEKEPLNEGEVIFDRELTLPGEDDLNDLYWKYKDKTRIGNRYWDSWTREKRDHPLVIHVVSELGEKANGGCAKLKIIKIPNNIKWSIDEYDGLEHIQENHRTWN